MAYAEWQVKICVILRSVVFFVPFFYAPSKQMCNIISLSSWCVFFSAIWFMFLYFFFRSNIGWSSNEWKWSRCLVPLSTSPITWLLFIQKCFFLINWCHSTLKFHHMWKWLSWSRSLPVRELPLPLPHGDFDTTTFPVLKFFAFDTQHVHTFCVSWTDLLCSTINTWTRTIPYRFDVKRQKVLVSTFRLHNSNVFVWLYTIQRRLHRLRADLKPITCYFE